jgi:hypothetical protein
MASEKQGSPAKPRARRPKSRPAGYGGPAKGKGNGNPRHDFDKKPGPGRGHYSLDGEGRLERQARHAEEMREILYGLASAETVEDSTRMHASEKLLNRLEGLPIQKVITAETDPLQMLSDAQLDDEIERTRSRAAKLQAIEEAQSAGDDC